MARPTPISASGNDGGSRGAGGERNLLRLTFVSVVDKTSG